MTDPRFLILRALYFIRHALRWLWRLLTTGQHGLGPLTPGAAARIERERCARIAETYTADWLDASSAAVEQITREAIAAKIRGENNDGN